LLEQFRALCRLPAAGSPREQLTALAEAFAGIPYENLTKIIKQAETGADESARRSPREVIADYERWRTGGTCFSLTATLLHLIRSAGLQAEPILADRRYGSDTHCALLVWLDGRPHLLDPGYLLVDPIPLDEVSGRLVVPTRFNQIELVRTDADHVELHTRQSRDQRYRLTFKTSPVDEQQFRRAWIASFDWDMMHYPLLTRVTSAGQAYMRGGHLQRRANDQVLREEIPQQHWVERMASEFGIHPQVIHRALEILRRRGD
jgi:arylamine N-acetyltransferase